MDEPDHDDLANENLQLRQWVEELEAFFREYTAHVMANSKVGQAKKRLLAKRPKFL